MLATTSDLLEQRLFQIVTTLPGLLALWFIIHHSPGKTQENCFYVVYFDNICWLLKETNTSLFHTVVNSWSQWFIELGQLRETKSFKFPESFYLKPESIPPYFLWINLICPLDENEFKTWRQTLASRDSGSHSSARGWGNRVPTIPTITYAKLLLFKHSRLPMFSKWLYWIYNLSKYHRSPPPCAAFSEQGGI